MALGLLENTLNEGQEGDSSFNFGAWINENGFESIKDVFIDNDMCTLNTLSMTNDNFGKLMSDPRILSTAQLIPSIVSALQSLDSLRETEKTKFVFMNEKETQILRQLKEYEYKSINDKYENKN